MALFRSPSGLLKSMALIISLISSTLKTSGNFRQILGEVNNSVGELSIISSINKYL